jgi:hypothetical protein
MTDIATGWTINRSVKNKSAVWVLEAIDEVAARFPFPILDDDSNNGAEYMNVHLFDYCKGRKITFTRSRFNATGRAMCGATAKNQRSTPHPKRNSRKLNHRWLVTCE